MGMQLAPPGLLRWFVRQLDKDRRDPDDERFNIRPASDDEAVKIMTVFKSKGLEFPIVFVPTLWRRQPSGRGHGESWLAYHGAATAGGVAPLVLNLDTGDAAGVEAAQAEREQEDVRLAYVALTRAVNRCYLLALDGCGASTALQRLIGRLDGRAAAAGGMEPVGIRQESGPLFAGCLTRWVPPVAPSGLAESAERRLPTPVIPLAGGHASFSSLMPHDGHTGPDAGVKDIDAADRDAGVAGAAGADLPADESSIFAIAGGAKTGNCWHDILETIDFQGSRSAGDAVVDAALDRDGICGWPLTDARVQGRRQAVKDMVRRVLTAPLPDGFRLCEVPMQARRSELAFHFTLRQHGAHRTMRDIYDAIDTHWRGPARNEAFLERLRGVGGALPQGFMTGYIDLVFEHGGRFHIVDWKSNRIGGMPAHFDAAGLAGEMALHGYYLQYLIYMVALDAFLRQRLAGYDYERHIGGVHYVFLRGVDETVPARGLFHERPAAELIATLSHVMAAGA